jgi:hypothetical protein
MSPDVGCSSPKIIFIKVDLPAPFSPDSAWISPALMEKLIPLLAITPLEYTFTMFSIRNTSLFASIISLLKESLWKKGLFCNSLL